MSVVSSPASAAPQRIRVMIVDDSAVARGLMTRWIEEEADFEVVASLRTGQEAIDRLDRADPDVVILDVEMPVLDGIQALPVLLGQRRDLVVIMASTLTRRNAEVSLKALSLGAADYIPKPESRPGGAGSLDFKRELVEKVRHLAQRRRRTSSPNRPAMTPPRAMEAAVEKLAAASGAAHENAIKLRPFAPALPKVLVIGSSTGGPQALNALVAQLSPVIAKAPVLVTQHMPPTFTTILAEHLARASGCPAHEGRDGEPVAAGCIYVAPGGMHMTVARGEAGPVIRLDDGPPVNFCRPAVDPLFASAAQMWGAGVLALVLTGMGADGSRGIVEIAGAGGNVIAQDEASSVVWGMPGAAAATGLCSAVLPLDRIGGKIVGLFSGDRS